MKEHFIQICTCVLTFYKSLKIEEISPENEVIENQEFSFKNYIIPLHCDRSQEHQNQEQILICFYLIEI